MRLLVAGAAGFIGSHVCDRLVERGDDIVGVDSLLTGSRDNVAHLALCDRFTLLKHDITQPFAPDGPFDFVLNLASPASPVDYMNHPIETLRVGSVGTQNLLDIAVGKGAKFLQASTSESYGDPQVHPQTEDYWGYVNPVGPRSVYDESKRYAEALTMAYHRYRALDTRIVRIFNTYGPRMQLNDGRVVPNFISQALSGKKLTVYGNGSQTRSFCYVSDLVDGIVRMLDCNEHFPVNLGNPNEITILEFAQRILELARSNSEIEYLPLPEDDPKQRRPDITKARRLLGWEPCVKLAEGLRLTIKFFEQKLCADART